MMKIHTVSDCCASARTATVPDIMRQAPVESIDSWEVTGAKRPLMNRTKISTYDRRYARGCWFVADTEFEKATRVLQKIPKDYPAIGDVYSLIASSYMGLKRANDALIYFEKVVTVAEWKCSHWCNLANPYIMHRMISKAAECLCVINRLGYSHDVKDGVDELKPEHPPAARDLAMLCEVRERASKDPQHIIEFGDYMQEGYF